MGIGVPCAPLKLIHLPREAAGVYVPGNVAASHSNSFTDQTSWSGSQLDSVALSSKGETAWNTK